MDSENTAKSSLGRKVFAGLMALTAFEFWIASMAYGPLPYPALTWVLAPITWLAVSAAANPLPYLGLMAVLKAGLIVRYFMHVSQIWSAEKGGHP